MCCSPCRRRRSSGLARRRSPAICCSRRSPCQGARRRWTGAPPAPRHGGTAASARMARARAKARTAARQRYIPRRMASTTASRSADFAADVVSGDSASGTATPESTNIDGWGNNGWSESQSWSVTWDTAGNAKDSGDAAASARQDELKVNAGAVTCREPEDKAWALTVGGVEGPIGARTGET
eukprot:9479804-Pyramimonas_sp.AAC.1